TMVHGERGDAMTPEEIGEYVKNSVIVSAVLGGSLDRFLFIRAGEGDDARDVCHVGNGPAGPWNAHLIAAAPDMLEALRTAVQLVETDVICARPGDRETLIAALRDWNAAITKATQGA